MNLDKTKLNYQNYKLSAASDSGESTFWHELPIAICQVDEQSKVLSSNEAATQLVKNIGYGDFDHFNLLDLIDQTQHEELLSFLSNHSEKKTSIFLANDQSSYIKIETGFFKIDPSISSFLVALTDVTTERKDVIRLEKKIKNQSRLISNQNSLLGLISDGKPIETIMSKAASMIEQAFDGVKVEVALVDRQEGRLVSQIAPSMQTPPGEMDPALDGTSSPSKKAIRLKTAVMVDDIEKDPIFKDLQVVLLSQGMHACWATPILDSDKEAVGVVTIYFNEKRFPVFEEISLVDRLVDLLKIAIEFHLNQGQISSQNQVLSQNEMLLGKIAENYPNAFILIFDINLVIRYASGQEFKNEEINPNDFVGKSAESFDHPDKHDLLAKIRSTFEGQERTFDLSYKSNNYVIKTVPLMSGAGQVDSVLVAITNDTTRIEMETELREYNDSLRKLSESSLSLTGDIDHIFSITMRILIDLLHVESISLLKIEGNQAHMVRSNQYGEIYRPDRYFDLIGCCEDVLHEKAPVLIDAKDARDDTLLKYLKASRLYLFPALNSRKEVASMIALALKEGVNLTSENAALVQIIGQRLAMEIEKNDVLKEKEDLSRFNTSIIQSLNEVTWDFYPKKSKIYWFGALEKVFGSGYAEVSDDVDDFIRSVHPTDRSAVIEKLFSKKFPEEKFAVEFQFEKEPEEYVWLKAEGIIHPNSVNEPDRIIGVLKNIHEQKLYEINRMRAVISAKDIERKRIASEIHDSLGQTLSAARLAFDSLIDDLGDSALHKDRIDSVMGLIRNAIDESRTISHDLMPPALSDFGLIPAVEKMIEKLDQSSSIDFEFIHNDISERFSEEFETNVFRIFQEAVNNIVKHSNASYATLQMIRHPGYVILTIEDDGVGFEMDKVSKGLGLKNMANRVENLGGNITIESVLGMTITIEIVI